jgi:hypothetical protein
MAIIMGSFENNFPIIDTEQNPDGHFIKKGGLFSRLPMEKNRR